MSATSTASPISVLGAAHDFLLRLPAFRGKARIAGELRRRMRPRPTLLPGGIAMLLDPDEWSQIELRSRGCLEPHTIALFDRLLEPGDTYVDVGAHVGYHALCARQHVGTTGRVFAIDPQPYNCDRILSNAELNGFSNIVVMAAAVGDAAGFVPLKQQSASDKARLTLLGAGVNDRAAGFIAPVVTLAWLFQTQAIDRAALLKIDVEGFELEVLQGAANVLRQIDNVILEILPGEEPDRVRSSERLLRTAGFDLFDVDGVEWQAGQPTVENNIWARRA